MAILTGAVSRGIEHRGYAHPEMLVTTDWVQNNAGNPAIRLIESNEDTLLYGASHIPGAVHVDWVADLNDPVRRDYIGPDDFAALMSRIGVTPGTTAVLYGDKSNWEGVLRSAEAEGQLVDGRSPQEYSGERLHMADYPNEGALRGGHIPGARNVPWARAINPEDGTFKTAAELKTIYVEEQGLRPDREEDMARYPGRLPEMSMVRAVATIARRAAEHGPRPGVSQSRP